MSERVGFKYGMTCPSCIPFLSILTYAALPMDGLGFLSNSDSYVILDNAFSMPGCQKHSFNHFYCLHSQSTCSYVTRQVIL